MIHDIGERYIDKSVVNKCNDFVQMDSQTGSPTIPQNARGGLICGSLTTRQYPQIKRKNALMCRVEEL